MKKKLISVAIVTALTLPAYSQTYRLTISNVGPQPLSPLFFSASDASFDIFQVGGSASMGIKDIAETGNAAAMLGIAGAAGSSVSTFGLLGASPLMPGNTRTTLFTTDAAHRMFSFATMLGMTNDGFLGESVSSMGLSLDNPIDLTITGARAWDAGSEANTQNQADLAALGGSGNPAEASGMNLIRVHSTIIPGQGDSWNQLPDWESNTPLMRVQVEAVPEPATLFTLGAATLGLIARRRKKA